MDLLMRDADAKPERILRAVQIQPTPIEPKLPCVWSVNPRDDFQQGALTCAVFAHEGMNLSEQIAAKTALEEAAAILAERVLPKPAK